MLAVCHESQTVGQIGNAAETNAKRDLARHSSAFPHRSLMPFIAADATIAGLEAEHMTESNGRASGSRSYFAGLAVAIVTSFLTLWTTIVRDDGTGVGSFLLIMAAGVGGFAAWFRPAGMARTMLGVAAMQTMWGIALATAPSTAAVADGPSKALFFSGVFTTLWLISAALFRFAALNHQDKDSRP